MHCGAPECDHSLNPFEKCLTIEYLGDMPLLLNSIEKILLQVSSEVALRRWNKLASIDASKPHQALCLNGTQEPLTHLLSDARNSNV